MLNLNGTIYHTLGALEAALDAIDGLPQESRAALINEFNGNPNEPVNAVPASITPRQIRIALIRSGILISQIEAFIDSLPVQQKEEVIVWWEYANEFLRSNELLNQMAALMGISQQQLDDIFILGNSL